ncbi:DNA-binding NtrC family response regulator [Methylobacterium sp. PvP062]|jgi:DNA-binding NtrC family response regulator|uniref:DNA-binding NtrC family response regulator n=2 Tax=Methylobacterium TaxID=407 RepID=A0ABV2NCG8_9HYPH|nr:MULTISPECIES: response regulator [Methylobacterium]MCX7333513.1 response regulator [Hyphomicrobiales bacterium]AYO83234.1 response regulator [Methylobacterium brachiatum]MBP2492582.1 DNA-binding NtrC family response regulator [Methylobacterium sp. PvP105]MBP2501046.1 DNA-binding NtrC family response regulator [Methylobacterium sp. PvP109]MDQ0440576.1 DNA-binding NtrC family response regulator [Methylobacterium persicinum]
MRKMTHAAPLALVVDDDQATRAEAETLLGETDLDVITCASGEAAVEVLQRCGDDVVMLLSTATLKGEVGGHQLATAAGRLRPGIRVVVSTGTPETCRKRVPVQTVCTRRPWLPLDILAQAHAALREPQENPA